MDADDITVLIATRVQELSPAEFTLIAAALSGDTVPTTILEDVMAVIEVIEERLEAFEDALGS